MAKIKWNIGSIVMFLLVVVALLWLFGQFFSVGGGTITTVDPFPNVSTVGFQLLQYAVIGILLFVAVKIFERFTGTSVTRKDIFVIILMGVGAILFYNYLGDKILGSGTFEDLVQKFGMKTGLLK